MATENWDWAEGVPLPPYGTEGNPLVPSSDVSSPRVRRRDRQVPADLLADMGEGTLFYEAVVARDGRVSNLTLLQGDQKLAGATSDRAENVAAFTRGALSTVGMVNALPRMSTPALV